MISCLGLCIVFGLTTTNCSVSNDIEQSPTPEQPKVAKYHNPIVSTSLPDPTVTKAGDGYFYLYATEDIRNLPIYRSKDLVNWNYVGTAFTDSSRPQWNPQGGIWAPDINVVNGRYMLYYSKSEWGGEWTCGIGIDTDSIDAVFGDFIKACFKLSLIDIMLILTDTDRLWLDFDQL